MTNDRIGLANETSAFAHLVSASPDSLEGMT